jgi:hypothetical protein
VINNYKLTGHQKSPRRFSTVSSPPTATTAEILYYLTINTYLLSESFPTEIKNGGFHPQKGDYGGKNEGFCFSAAIRKEWS